MVYLMKVSLFLLVCGLLYGILRELGVPGNVPWMTSLGSFLLLFTLTQPTTPNE